jgi:hypothetical protein
MSAARSWGGCGGRDAVGVLAPSSPPLRSLVVSVLVVALALVVRLRVLQDLEEPGRLHNAILWGFACSLLVGPLEASAVLGEGLSRGKDTCVA